MFGIFESFNIYLFVLFILLIATDEVYNHMYIYMYEYSSLLFFN